jgi:uncharacterized phiE125 gp8 family phage protein
MPAPSIPTYSMRYRATTAPAEQPVTLAEVKEHLRITGTDEDTVISSMISAATAMAELWTGRRFITQTLTGWLDADPVLDAWWDGIVVASRSSVQATRSIELPGAPGVSVTSVSLFSDLDAETVIASTDYRVDAADQDLPTRITLKETSSWPSVSLRNQNALKVVWIAGYGAAASVPSSIKLAIKMMVANLYANRGECSENALQASGAAGIISSYRMLRL